MCDVFSMAGRYNKLVQYERESAHKSGVAGGNATLDNCRQREQHHQGDVGDLQRGLGEVNSCGLCPVNSKGILLSLCQHLSAPASCRRQDFVDARILSRPIFYQRQDFVNANNFVEAYILSAPIFCRRQCFVGVNILSPPIFLILFRLRLNIIVIINFCLNPLGFDLFFPVDCCLVHNKSCVRPHLYCFILALGCEESRVTARMVTGS